MGDSLNDVEKKKIEEKKTAKEKKEKHSNLDNDEKELMRKYKKEGRKSLVLDKLVADEKEQVR